MAGALIVLEGTDGSGKSTQFQLLGKAMEERGIPFQRLVFPQYSEPSSALIRMYLNGEFGTNPSDVNAYAASAFYAVDRYASYQKVWQEYYRQGGMILSDRYTTSNAVHQASKLPEGEREEFFRWLTEFEQERLGLPAPSRVFWLDMPLELALKNLRERESATHTNGDIHEVDSSYLQTCYATAQQAAAFYGWTRISCVDEQGTLRTPECISLEILTHLGL